MQIQYGQRGGRSVGTAGCLQPRLQHGDISPQRHRGQDSSQCQARQDFGAGTAWKCCSEVAAGLGTVLECRGRAGQAPGSRGTAPETPMCCVLLSAPQRSLSPGGSGSQQPRPFQDAFPTNHPPKHAAQFNLTGRRDAAQRRTCSVKLLQGRDSRGPSWL